MPPLRERSDLWPYQERAARFIRQHPRAALLLDMGLGKTASTLTAFADMLDRFETHGALVVAPRRVTESVWKQEAAMWRHLAHLRVCILRGKKTEMECNLIRPFHLWIINYEMLPWLLPAVNKLFLSHHRPPPWDLLVFDELSRVKNVDGRRVGMFYAANKSGTRFIDLFPRRIGLTGTPLGNGYLDLHGQYYALDDGQSLGSEPLVYKERFFKLNYRTGRWDLDKGADKKIQKLIEPITLSMLAEDLIRLPEQRVVTLPIRLPPKLQAQYESLEETFFAEFDHGTVELRSASAMTAKCRQLANGFIYDADGNTAHYVHRQKMDALEEIVEESAGKPLLIAYTFRADMHRIVKTYGERAAYLGPGVNDDDGRHIIAAWNRQEIEILVTHPASAGHGLNLQHGGHQIVWFGLDWPLELHLQMNARLRRPGQKHDSVTVFRIVAENTLDEVVAQVIDRKDREQRKFRLAMRDRETETMRPVLDDDTIYEEAIQDYRKQKARSH